MSPETSVFSRTQINSPLFFLFIWNKAEPSWALSPELPPCVSLSCTVAALLQFDNSTVLLCTDQKLWCILVKQVCLRSCFCSHGISLIWSPFLLVNLLHSLLCRLDLPTICCHVLFFFKWFTWRKPWPPFWSRSEFDSFHPNQSLHTHSVNLLRMNHTVCTSRLVLQFHPAGLVWMQLGAELFSRCWGCSQTVWHPPLLTALPLASFLYRATLAWCCTE